MLYYFNLTTTAMILYTNSSWAVVLWGLDSTYLDFVQCRRRE